MHRVRPPVILLALAIVLTLFPATYVTGVAAASSVTVVPLWGTFPLSFCGKATDAQL